MTLGGRITALRTARGMSQAELAEQLEVSRQSVSKWETDASVPELDKLVKMAALFTVTLDELVTGAAPSPAADGPGPEAPDQGAAPAQETPGRETAPEPGTFSAPAASGTETRRPLARRQIAGLFLLGLGALIVILLFALGGGLLWPLLVASPLLLAGVICLLVRWHTGLWALWGVWLPIYAYLRYATGIRFWWAFMPWVYRPEMGIAHGLIAWLQCLAWAGLLIATVLVICRAARRKKA